MDVTPFLDLRPAPYAVLDRLATHRDRPRLSADPVGKVATIAQFAALSVAVAQPAWALPPAILAATLGVAAVVHYIVRFARSERYG